MKRVLAWVLNPYILLTLTMVVGSANLVAGRGVVGEVPPLTLSFWRWFTAVMVVLPFGLRPLIKQRRLLLRHGWLLLSIAATGIAAFNSFLYLGLQTTTALNGSLILATIPVSTVAIAWVIFRERIDWRIASGMVSALFGVTIIILRGQPSTLLDLAFNHGDILVLLSVLCWAAYSILLGRLPPGIQPMALMLLTAFIGWVLLIPFYLWDLAAGRVMVLTPHSLIAILYVGIFASVIGYAAFAKGVALVGANVASQFTYLNPLFGGAWAILLLGEELRTYHIAGAVLIFLGIYLATSGGVRVRKPA